MMQVRLYISSFRVKIRNVISIGLKIIVIIISLAVTSKGLTYVLIDDTDRYSRIMIHELYNQDENIDILFLGSSHSFTSINPKITDVGFNKNTFNAGTSGQRLDGSYALLVEANKLYDIEEVYLELYYGLMKQTISDRVNPTEMYLISDYMKPSINKYRYICCGTEKQHWIKGIVPSRRNWRDLFDLKYMAWVATKKGDSSYRNYDYINTEGYRYEGKGFISEDKMLENDGLKNDVYKSISDPAFSKDTKRWLQDIIEYCNKNGIKLVLYSTPLPKDHINGIGNYDSYIKQVDNLISQYGVEYYDFNTCKNDYFSGDNSLFKDRDHLNSLGADIFSHLFVNVFANDQNKSDFFYPSYEEKRAFDY